MNEIVPSKDEFFVIKEICNNAMASQLLPKNLTLPGAVLVALKGRELGIPPIMALSEIAVINGKTAMSAVLMMSLVQKAYPHLKVKYDQTETKCTVSVLENTETGWQAFSFSMDDAERAGLLFVYPGKQPGPWHKFPRAMMRSRAVSEMCRALFPAALMGSVYTPEELGGQVRDVELEPINRPIEEIKQVSKPVNQAPQSNKTVVPPVDLTISSMEPQSTFDDLDIPMSAAAPILPKKGSLDAQTKANQPQLKRLFTMSNERGVTEELLKKILLERYGYTSTKDLKVDQYNELISFIEKTFAVIK